MRKVLLRFFYDDMWQWRSVGNELHVGIAWPLLLWAFIATVALIVRWRLTRSASAVLMELLFWMIVPVAAGLAALLKVPAVRSGIPVFGYGVMMFIGFSSGTWLAARRIRRVGLPSAVIWDMMMWALIPGLIGARLTFLTQHGSSVFAGPHAKNPLLAIIALWDGGLVFYGSVIGGIAGVFAYSRLRQLRFAVLLDVIAPSMLLGEAFGRIGCFLYGCCWGRVCSLPWAVHFPPDSLTYSQLIKRNPAAILPDQSATVGLHPTQLYSSATAFLIAGILAWYFRRRHFDGAVLSLALILYSVNRFVLETFRDDEAGRLGTGLTFSQLVSIAMLIAGSGLMVLGVKWLPLTRQHPPISLPDGKL